MCRFLIPLLVTVFLIGIPLMAQAADTSFFGPIVPTQCNCPGEAPGLGCILESLRLLMNLIISIACVFLTLIIAYGGLLFMMGATNPSQRETGRNVLINGFIGIVIVLSAWLLVDFIMKRLYNSNSFGPWNSILLGQGELCLHKQQTGEIFTGNIVVTPTTNPGSAGGAGGSGGSGANCPAADPGSMVNFPASATSGAAEKATPTTVQNFLAMRAAALKEGIDLKVTDGYRSESEQIALWDRYGHDTSQAARPCTLGGGGSNHNSGTAVDLTVGCAKTDSSCNSPQYRWLKANGSKWNFRNALPTDTVHWSPSGT
ncbi:MAG: D-alanyl-D-alanine carboxypeptidase family protein [Patescibacteria group bacterium]